MIAAVKFRENFTIYELGCGNGRMMFEIKKKCDRPWFKKGANNWL